MMVARWRVVCAGHGFFPSSLPYPFHARLDDDFD